MSPAQTWALNFRLVDPMASLSSLSSAGTHFVFQLEEFSWFPDNVELIVSHLPVLYGHLLDHSFCFPEVRNVSSHRILEPLLTTVVGRSALAHNIKGPLLSPIELCLRFLHHRFSKGADSNLRICKICNLPLCLCCGSSANSCKPSPVFKKEKVCGM